MTTRARKAVAVVAIVIAALAVLGGVIAGIWFGVNTDKYQGYVRDEAGEPIAGVSVTNGRDVVKTDENGFYKLDGWLKDRFVTVTIPSGYWTEDFYRDKDSDNFDFVLEKRTDDMTDHSFLQVADSEIGEGGVGPWIENVKQAAQDIDAAFIIHTGDICYEDGLRTHIEGMNSDNMGVPVRYAIGNHDYIDKGGYGEAYYESLYGPVNYSFEVGNVHYIVTPMISGTDYRARYGYNDIWKWVEGDIANVEPGKKIVMFNHNYCPDEDGFVLEYGLGKSVDLTEHGLLAWVFGHWHYNYMYETEDGVFNICTGKPDSGNIDSTAPCVRGVWIEDDELVRSEPIYNDFESGAPSEGYEWTTALDGRNSFASVLADGGAVYVSTIDDGWPKECGIYKLDAATGEILWSYATANSVRNDFALYGGKLIAQDVTGKVYCLDAASGEEAWTYDCGLLAAHNTGLSVATDGERIYCGGSQKTVCLNMSGALVWETSNDRANSAPSRIVVDGDRIYVGSHWDELIAYDKLTGKRIWAVENDGLRNRSTTPVVADGKLYVAAIDTMFELDRESGKVVRSRTFEEYNFDTATQPLVKDGRIYLATAENGVVALDEKTFDTVWVFEEIGDSLISSSPYVKPGGKEVASSVFEAGGKICFGALDGCLYALNADGTLAGKYDVGSPIVGKPAAVDGGMIVSDFSGNVTKVAFSALGI